MLREEFITDKIEIMDDGEIRVRRARRIYDGDTLIAQTYHREPALMPGDDVTEADERVRRIAQATWTPAVITAHAERQARAEAALPRAQRASTE